MDSPVRKMQKEKDYQRHKLFRKMKRRRKAKAEQELKIAEKALKKKLKLPKYDDGDEPNLFKQGDRYFYQESPESKEISVTPINTTFDNSAYWTYQDAEGRIYTPKQLPTSDPGEIKPAEQKNVLESALDNYVGELQYGINNSIPIGGKYTMPAIAASALLPLAGEAVAPVLANPYVDAGLTSIFAGHGLNHVINEGINGYGDVAMTALEIAPLGRLARPLWRTAANTGTALYNDMYIPYKISNAIDKGVKENAVITAYNRNPATKDIGNLWDYKSYLDNVFPNSKVKDVLWHGSTSKNLQTISPEYIGTNTPIKKSVGMYLAPERYTAVGYGTRGDVYPVLLNTENPFITDQFFGGVSKNGVNVTKISPEVRSTLLANNDAVIAPKRGEIAFFNPDNALILGSDADVAGFRRFMSKPQITAENAASITPEQWTAAQDAAIANGDIAEAQRLRDLHFKLNAPNTLASVNGQPLQLYHGTDAAFNAFDLSKYGSTDGGTFGRGVYTTPVKEYAELYGKNNIPLYMKLDNPRDYRNYTISDLMAEKFAFGDDFATGNGIDGVIGRPSWKGFKGLEEWVSHNPKNIKSSLPVTYADDGTRIPLGERDNFSINDIRYGLLPFLGLGTLGTLQNYDRGKDRIHIKPSKRGTFTAAAKKHGASVQEYARKVLKAPKGKYSAAMRRKANFARNAARWRK